MEDIRIFIRNMIQSVFKTRVINAEEISGPIVAAIKEIENETVIIENIENISNPIVEAIKENKIEEVSVKDLESLKIDLTNHPLQLQAGETLTISAYSSATSAVSVAANFVEDI